MNAPDGTAVPNVEMGGIPHGFSQGPPPGDDDPLPWGTEQVADDVLKVFDQLQQKNGTGRAPIDFMANRGLWFRNDDHAYLDQMVRYLHQAGAERLPQAWHVAQLFTLPGQFGRYLGETERTAQGVLWRLFEETRPHRPEDTRPNGEAKARTHDDGTLVLSPTAPLDTARELIKRHFTSDSQQTLRHQQATFYHWTGTAYAELPHESVRATVYTFLDGAKAEGKRGRLTPFKPNAGRVTWAIDALAAAAQLPPTVNAPAWLSRDDMPAACEMLAFKNGILHLPTGRLLPHSPQFFNLNAADYPYDPDEPVPDVWLQFLADLWPDDAGSIETLQDMFGLMLTTDTSHQKAFMLVGPKRGGKGTTARVLTGIVGKANVAGPTLSSLGDRFGIAPLIGKPLAIISDARLSGRSDPAMIAERLLSISGEDGITVDRKNRDAWHGTMPTRFLLLTNELPRLTDASGALVSRFIVLQMTASFYGREDHGLTNKLLAVRPGILNWSLEGYRRLRERGHFIQPQSAEAAIRQMEDLGSPVRAFVRDRCIVRPGVIIDCQFLFDAWAEWCREMNREHVGTQQTFGRDLNAAVLGLKITQPRANGARTRCYDGITLAP